MEKTKKLIKILNIFTLLSGAYTLVWIYQQCLWMADMFAGDSVSVLGIVMDVWEIIELLFYLVVIITVFILTGKMLKSDNPFEEKNCHTLKKTGIFYMVADTGAYLLSVPVILVAAKIDGGILDLYFPFNNYRVLTFGAGVLIYCLGTFLLKKSESCQKEQVETKAENPRRGITKREREVTDMEEIISILDKSKVLHLGLVDGDEPYVVPMNYGYIMEDEKLTVYLHGALQGRKLDLIRQNPKVFFELDCDIVPFEGKTACNYGITYASVMASGKAVIVEDIEEKKKGLTVLMKTQTGKDFDINEKMAAVVAVIRIDVDCYTAKKRPQG